MGPDFKFPEILRSWIWSRCAVLGKIPSFLLERFRRPNGGSGKIHPQSPWKIPSYPWLAGYPNRSTRRVHIVMWFGIRTLVLPTWNISSVIVMMEKRKLTPTLGADSGNPPRRLMD